MNTVSPARFVSTLFVALLALSVAAPAASAAPTAEQLKHFEGLVADPPPESITRNAHYVVSNENRPYLFYPHRKALGGVMVGVGTDQLFLYAGWFKPEVLVPMDFDQVVVDLHHAYTVMFAEAETPQQLIDMFDKDNRKKTVALLEAKIADPDRRKKAVRAYKMGQRLIHGRFRRLLRKFAKQKVDWFLSDKAQYDYVRKLQMEGRVFPVRGDLTADKTMKSIAKASRAAGIPVRVLYNSNAEQYFKWSQQYRDNIAAMNFDDRSIVLRTMPDGAYGYYYFMQKGHDFQQWVKHGKTRSTWRMLRSVWRKLKSPTEEQRFYVVDSSPPTEEAEK